MRSGSRTVSLRCRSRDARSSAVGSVRSIPSAPILRGWGGDGAKKHHRPIGAGLEILRPFERVEMDEQKIDLISMLSQVELMPLFTPEELKLFGLTNEKGRWWICMAVDCRTKVIAGLILTNDPKSSAAAHCRRMVVSDKGGWLMQPGPDPAGTSTPASKSSSSTMDRRSRRRASPTARMTSAPKSSAPSPARLPCTGISSASSEPSAGGCCRSLRDEPSAMSWNVATTRPRSGRVSGRKTSAMSWCAGSSTSTTTRRTRASRDARLSSGGRSTIATGNTR